MISKNPHKFFILILIFCCSLKSNSQNSKPNVVVIYTDDHRYSAVHKLGNKQLKTPHMDNLIDNGIHFSNTYLQGAFTGATCTPSRAMLLTGRDVFHLDGIGKNIPKQHISMPEAFEKEGYHTFTTGKWDQDKASFKRSFDEADQIMGLGPYVVDHFQMPLWDYNSKLKKFSAPYILDFNANHEAVKRKYQKEVFLTGPFHDETRGPHTSELFAQSTVNYINTYKKKQPFFIYLPFHAPHDPREAPKRYLDMYPVETIELPPSYQPQHPFDNGHIYLRDEKLAPWPRTKHIVQKELAAYYALITHLDHQIGKVIQALKNKHLYKNTIILLAGDSGLAVGNHGLLGKQNLYSEDGIHVPFIIGGGFVQQKGLQINALNYIHDIFPTLCDLAKIPTPKSVQGKSLMPVLEKKTKQIRDYTYHAYLQYQRAIRKGDYKLIEYVKAKDYNSKTQQDEFRGSRVTQLFNLKKDPWETQNLAIFPEYKAKIKQLQQQLREAAITHEDNAQNLKFKHDFWKYYTPQ